MESLLLPPYIDAFVSPVRDNPVADVAIIAVLILIVLDVIFGLGNAIAQHKYSSEIMRKGIAHKCAELGFILVGVVCDATIIGGVDLGFTAPVLVSVCVYLAIMEIGSLLETFADMNPELANSPLFQLLASVQKKKLDIPKEDTDDDKQ